MVTSNASPQRRYSTPELARLVRVETRTVRASLYRKGSFLGLIPAAKLPSGRLLWDADQVDRLITPQPAEASPTTTRLNGGAQ